MHACWRGRSMRPILDHRENVMGLCRLARKVCKSIGERWHDVAGSWLTFRFRSHRRLHACWRGWWARQNFEHQKRSFDGACGGAQSARVLESDGATALGYRVMPMRAHFLAQAVDMTDFATENRCWDCAGGGAQSTRRSETDGAMAQPVCSRWVSITPMHARHVGMGS